ncbi:AraC family transcriptional regulator [Chryseosolibacter indicus]|uniref:Helix-turn-helix domain-containing protein n=1 Tax=Chryseosolibacter indicus TaxID=2782351 RepID=A0ABS5VSN8_9BACT|nr:AraC family transcriptional regulator [Chryseosolibacter indicus]MBT1703789.1 helix-turn-helix domain-containing protein [Chryseosolibacter indicus]
MAKKREAPLFHLDAFSKKAQESSFYIEKLETHLRNHKFVSKPHNHDFYLLLYIKNGGGEHTIDFKAYTIYAGSFFLMTPGQVHSWNLKEGTEGYIIFFLPAFYKMQSQESNLLAFPFFHSLSANPHLIVDDDTKNVIDFIMKQMLKEFAKSAKTDLRILRNYLEIILLKLSAIYPTQEAKDLVNGNSYKIRKLEQLIEKHYLKLKQPSQYAELMNLSASYLNSLCKQTLGKTLTDMISQRLILEAKRLFSYSDLNVNQVATQLNFSDPSYFIRFFKKHTKQTPEQFKDTMQHAV